MLAETWYTAEEALAAGLVDRIDDSPRLVTSPNSRQHQHIAASAASRQVVLAVAAARRRRNQRTQKG